MIGHEEDYPLETTIDRDFTPDYQQRTDGEACASRDGFARHIRAVRALAADGTIKVREAIREGNRIADRHEVTVTRRDGATSRIEVYLFGGSPATVACAALTRSPGSWTVTRTTPAVRPSPAMEYEHVFEPADGDDCPVAVPTGCHRAQGA